MSSTRTQLNSDCRSADISSYIDGDLTPDRQIELEQHVASCGACLDELNLQKKFLIALEQALTGEEDVELPSNFTQVVVANAESRVNGLRRSSERYDAFFVCAGLFFLIIFALGASGSNTAFDPVFIVLEKISAIASFAGHVVYDLAVGVVIVIRSLGSQLILGSSLSTFFPGAVAIFIVVASRLAALIGRN